MGNRRVSAHRIRKGQPYDVRQAARALGVSKPTVRRWAKEGLNPVEGVFPPIFRGVDIKDFVRRRAECRRQPCGPGRIFCFRCKSPKTPALDEVEFHAEGPTLGRLVGFCPDCLATLIRRTSRAKLTAAAGNLKVTFKPAESRLAGTFEPGCNVNSEGN
ncbi:MAG: helix-turn-helix domain-containing protein [Rhizobiaceae bacterium]|nr:helix-turn-helix domain-containing protein [Rhizobiaceae bacterium]